MLVEYGESQGFYRIHFQIRVPLTIFRWENPHPCSGSYNECIRNYLTLPRRVPKCSNRAAKGAYLLPSARNLYCIKAEILGRVGQHVYDRRRGIRDDSLNRWESWSTWRRRNMVPSHPTIFKRWEERANAKSESSRTGRAMRWSLHCFCTLGSSRREIRGVCWASRWRGWTRDWP